MLRIGNTQIARLPRRTSQRGVMMVIVLVALVSMTLGGIALFRSVDTGVLVSANVSYQRDVTNRAGEAMIQVLRTMVAANPSPNAMICADTVSCGTNGGGYPFNISMRVLETDPNGWGVPTILTQGGNRDFSAFDALYTGPRVLVGDSNDAAMKVESRYLIERMTVDFLPSSTSNSVIADLGKVGGTDPNKGVSSGNTNVTSPAPLYRVTVRVDGPRNTRAYAQAIVSMPN